MNLVCSGMSGRVRHVCVATATAAVLAVVSLAAQFGDFNEAFSGELWAVRHEIFPGGGATPGGVAFVGGTLFVADMTNRTVIAYDSNGVLVAKPGAQWSSTDPASPVQDFIPNQLAAAVVNVNGTDQTVLLISDDGSNRVAAFDTAGAHLFTLRLYPPLTQTMFFQSTGMVAMSAGAKFNLTTSSQTLTLSGTFAAGRIEQESTGEVESATLVFQGSAATFMLVDSEFNAEATTVLRGTEAQVSPIGTNRSGVAFDTVGNLYVLDSATERLYVYGPDLSHLFTFGTPAADGSVTEFQEPWGMVFWPDATGTGGRLFINDTYNNRIMIFRPVDGPDPDGVVDALQLESVIKNFVEPDPELFSIAFDPSTGSLAVTDFSVPRVIVLQQAQLATFDFQVLDSTDGVIDSVCTGAQYKVRFSLTVPAGFAPVDHVAPQLTIDGVLTSAPAIPFDVYPSSTLSAGQVVTYTYTLTAPDEAGDDIQAIAGATADTDDILMRSEVIPLSDCAGETDPSTITATPIALPQATIRLPQVSGWTPVFEGETFAVRLAAHDNDGIVSIQYQLEGANDTGDDPESVTFDGGQPDAAFDVPIPNPGRTTLRYRVRDSNQIWSAWQSLAVNPQEVVNRSTNENTTEVFRLGEPDGATYTYSVSGLPAGATFSTSTGQFGGVISYNAHDQYSANPAVNSGEYHVVVTERASSGATSSVGFTWTINNVNRPPDIVQVTDQVNTEGDTVSLQVVATDPDGDPLGEWNVTGLPPGLSLSQTGRITGTLGYSTAGVYDPVHVSVDDGVQPSITTFKWTVKKRPPSVTNPGPQSNSETNTVLLQISATDYHGDPLSYSATGLPQLLSINPLTGLISGTLTYSSAGNYSVEVSVTGGGQTTKVTFPWAVANVNRPPTASAPPVRVNAENDTVSFTITSNDPDGDPLTFSATGLPPGISIHPVTGVISGTLGFTSAGIYNVVVKVSDGPSSATAPFVWTVTDSVPPVVRCVIVDFREITYFKGERVITSSDAGIRTRNGILGPFNPLLWPYSSTASATSTTATKSRGTVFRLYGFKASEVGTLVPNADNPLITYPVVPDLLIPGAYYIDMLGPARVSVCPQQLHNYALDTLDLPGDMPGTAMLPVAQRNVPGVMLSHNTQVLTLPARIKTEMAALGLSPTNKGLIDYVGYQLQGYGSAAFKEFVDVQFSWAEDSETNRRVHFEKGFHTAMTHDLEGSVSCDYLDSAAADDAMRLRDFWGSNRRSGVTYAAWQACGAREPAANQKKRANYVVPFNAVQILPTVNTNVDSLRLFYGEIRRVVENRAPSAVDDAISTGKGTTAVIAVLANDSDPDGDVLTVTAVTAPSKGSASIQPNGTIKYVAPTTLTAPTTTTFTYTVSDGRGGTDTATVTVTLTVPNRAPVAVNDSVSVAKGASKVISVLANDSDPDGNPLTVSIVTAPAKGTAVANGNGTITYTAPSNFTGTTTFTYKVSDGNGGTATATVTVTVTNSSSGGNNNNDDDDCGDRNHDHERDDDHRDRDHRRGDHTRCRHK